MPASIIADLLELMPDTVQAQYGNVDALGAFTPSGAAVSVPCYIEMETKLTRNMAGQEVVSSAQVYTGGVFSLTVDHHRYTLPSRFSPRLNIKAVRIDRASDENGAHHEVVMLP